MRTDRQTNEQTEPKTITSRSAEVLSVVFQLNVRASSFFAVITDKLFKSNVLHDIQE